MGQGDEMSKYHSVEDFWSEALTQSYWRSHRLEWKRGIDGVVENHVDLPGIALCKYSALAVDYYWHKTQRPNLCAQ